MSSKIEKSSKYCFRYTCKPRPLTCIPEMPQSNAQGTAAYQQQSELASRHVVVIPAAPALPKCKPLRKSPTSTQTRSASWGLGRTLCTPLAAWKARMIAGLHLKRSCGTPAPSLSPLTPKQVGRERGTHIQSENVLHALVDLRQR